VDAFHNAIRVKPRWAAKLIDEELGLAEKWAEEGKLKDKGFD
jgi:hypothetical protein